MPEGRVEEAVDGFGDEQPLLSTATLTMHSTFGVSLVLLACASNEGDPSPGTNTPEAGHGGTTGGAGAGSAGSASSAGGNAGRAAGGNAGIAGAAAGNAAGSGGLAAGNGGSAPAGAGGTASGSAGTAGSAGMLGGAGGRVGEGGAAHGGAGTGPMNGGRDGAGNGGMSAGAGGSAVVDTTLAGTWDGALLKFPCGNTHDAYNCSNTSCTNNQTTKTSEWVIGGTSGAIYEVTFNVRGVVETYYYPGATRDGGSIKDNPDLFASGGNVQDSSGSNYDYNTYQLVVTPPVAGEANKYFLNSVTQAENPHASNSPTTHVTFPIDYTKTIKVTGGGKVTFTTFDSNCTFLQNCGPTQGSTCANPRTVSLTGTMPAAPTSFMQPFQEPTGAYGQWVFFDLTKIIAAP